MKTKGTSYYAPLQECFGWIGKSPYKLQMGGHGQGDI